LKISFVDDSSDLDTSGEGNLDCTSSDTAALDNLDISTSITYEVYSGKKTLTPNTDIDNSDMLTIGSAGNTVSSGKMVSGMSLTFYPYIQMRYDTISETDKTVYVLGQYQRSLQLNDYAEVKWSKTSSPNMVLDSLQWSTHAQAIADKGIEVSGTSVKMGGNVLPGGAELNLTIPKANRQKVTVTSWQCVLSGDGEKQVNATGSASGETTTVAQAKAKHEEYVQSVKSGLEGLGVQQWQNNDDTANPFDGMLVYPGVALSGLPKTGTTTNSNTEAKYYFRSDSSYKGQSNYANLDVNVNTTSYTNYVFSSDVSGNILMNGTVILTKGQTSSNLTNTVAKEINSRTYIVDKLVVAIERNSGEDSDATWVSDGKWYNEAFDGITVVKSVTVIDTGFNTPYTRSAIQDPKLNVKSTGQSNMFADYMVSAYKMATRSTAYSEDYVIGQFKGANVKMKDMDKLYYTKNYYVTNVTVQDLH
jgi:hypothetical protein